jgi:hypothetical protein
VRYGAHEENTVAERLTIQTKRAQLVQARLKLARLKG